jgi:hypothetical protein
MASCLTTGCPPTSYCGDVEESGHIDVRQCLPLPNGCTTCLCALNDLRSYYTAHFPNLSLPPCTCGDANGSVDGGIPLLTIWCTAG